MFATSWRMPDNGHQYHQNGALASEGNSVDGVEHGPWRDYQENGQLAAEGQYEHGQENGKWRYWNRDGSQSLGNHGLR